MIKGAIFDMDGTLLDAMPVWEHACERYLKKQGIDADEGLSDTLFTLSMYEGAAYVKKAYGMETSIEEIVDGVNALVVDAYRNEVLPKEGVREFLEQLKNVGVPMVVATSTDRPMAEAALTRTGLISYFTKIFTCTEIGVGKSKPDIYHAAARCIGSKPEDTWVFEDALYAAQTAAAAGYRTVGIYDATSRRQKQEEQLKKTVDGYVADWRELVIKQQGDISAPRERGSDLP